MSTYFHVSFTEYLTTGYISARQTAAHELGKELSMEPVDARRKLAERWLEEVSRDDFPER
jgi:hypothetical protein